MPFVPEDYVHRIGRTGRAGARGQAVSLVSSDESKQLAAIERLIKKKIPKEILSGFKPSSSNQPKSFSSTTFKRVKEERNMNNSRKQNNPNSGQRKRPKPSKNYR